MSENPDLTRMVEKAVCAGVTSVEGIHRDIAALPVAVLEQLGLPEERAQQVQRMHEGSIGAVYDVIRSVNHRVADLAHDLLELDRA